MATLRTASVNASTSARRSSPLEDLLLGDALKLLADAIAERLGVAGVPDSERYYTAKTSPLPRRKFLSCARTKAFPSFIVGRVVYALREDVHRFIESRRAHTNRPVAVKTGAPEASRDELDVLLVGAHLTRSPRGRR